MNTPTANDVDPGAPLFSEQDWQKISIDAPATLDLYGEQNRGYLELSLTNSSAQRLDPCAGFELVFSFRVLDADGEALPVEGVRTSLTRPVEPGHRHSQRIKVIIPAEQLASARAIRVGMLVENHYWVESLCPEHPKTVRIHKPEGLTPAEARLAAASQIWGQRKVNGLRWPYGSIMVAESHKLMYIPVAKCACTSLKSMMVKLAGIEQPDIAVELDVHFVTDRFNTGAQLKDKPIDMARQLLASEDYVKFSVIRDPLERLVSAYLEKFVYNRQNPRNLLHIRKVIGEVQGSEQIDLSRSITFDEFLEYITGQDPVDLDPHWRPQYLYFLGVPHISRIFRLDKITELEQYLWQNRGIKVQLGHKNKTRKSDIFLPGAATMNASQLDERGAINPASFLTSGNRAAIELYYREDLEFYNADNR